MNEFFQLFCTGAAGAASFEVLKLYELRGKLHQKKYRGMLRSPIHWAVVVGMIAASGFFAWAFCSGRTPTPSVAEVAILGVGAVSLVREVTAARLANARTTLGSDHEADVSTRDMFL